jgi:hypothetical protein
MLKTNRLTRTVAIAIAVASLGTSTAFARPADTPSREALQAAAQRWTPPRVESIGVRHADPVAAAPASPAVPLTHPANTGGLDLLSVAFGASAMLALLLMVAVVYFGWPRAHPIRARRA